MNRCPGCDYIVPGAWTECRRCGATLQFAQSPPPPAPPPAPPFAAPAPIPAPKLDTMLPDIGPTITVAPPAPARFSGRTIAIAVVAVLAVGFAITHFTRGAHHATSAPVVLTPEAPFAGLPTSLSAIVRIEAESSRHTALSVVISAASPNGAPLTLAALTGLQPGYQWVGSAVPSTTNTMISVASSAGSDVLAVAGTNKSICAYGRWTPSAGSTYVTMDNVKTCSATTAPAAGWSPLPGGTAQDLPGENGS